MHNNINSVQAFIKFMAFIVGIIIFAIVFIPLISIRFSANLDNFGFLIFLFGGLALWISVILSKMFYVLPEWDRLILFKISKFVNICGLGYFVILPFIYSVTTSIALAKKNK